MVLLTILTLTNTYLSVKTTEMLRTTIFHLINFHAVSSNVLSSDFQTKILRSKSKEFVSSSIESSLIGHENI